MHVNLLSQLLGFRPLGVEVAGADQEVGGVLLAHQLEEELELLEGRILAGAGLGVKANDGDRLVGKLSIIAEVRFEAKEVRSVQGRLEQLDVGECIPREEDGHAFAVARSREGGMVVHKRWRLLQEPGFCDYADVDAFVGEEGAQLPLLGLGAEAAHVEGAAGDGLC